MLSFRYMEDFDSRDRLRNRIFLDDEKERTFNQHSEARREFVITHIDDNSVFVRNSLGQEIAFQYPLGSISFKEYDKFVEQMSDTAAPLPSIDNLILGVSQTIVDPSRAARERDRMNSNAHGRTIEGLARDLGIDADQLLRMLLFARQALYDRFKTRLRGPS